MAFLHPWLRVVSGGRLAILVMVAASTLRTPARLWSRGVVPWVVRNMQIQGPTKWSARSEFLVSVKRLHDLEVSVQYWLDRSCLTYKVHPRLDYSAVDLTLCIQVDLQ